MAPVGRGTRSKSAPRCPQPRGERRWQRILAAAEALFAERGYPNTSLQAIAGDAARHLRAGRRAAAAAARLRVRRARDRSRPGRRLSLHQHDDRIDALLRLGNATADGRPRREARAAFDGTSQDLAVGYRARPARTDAHHTRTRLGQRVPERTIELAIVGAGVSGLVIGIRLSGPPATPGQRRRSITYRPRALRAGVVFRDVLPEHRA